MTIQTFHSFSVDIDTTTGRMSCWQLRVVLEVLEVLVVLEV